MKKLLTTILLTFISTNVMAEWDYLQSDTNGGYTIYVDFSRIHKIGNIVKVWNLTDFKTLQTAGSVRFLSSILLQEFDCKEEQSRGRYIAEYSENMGHGEILYNVSYNTDWSPVIPGTMNETLFKMALLNCNMK